MTNGSKRCQALRALFMVLAGLTGGVLCSYAAGTSYDIDLKELKNAPFDINLKELRPSPVHRPKTPHRRQTPRSALPAPPVAAGAPEGSSSYTIRPGDYPLLILIRHYGLSQTAAEKMVPQVMQLNNLQDPRRLTVGQRLLIPLVPPGQASRADTASSPPATPVAVTALTPPAVPPGAPPAAPPAADRREAAPAVPPAPPAAVPLSAPSVVLPPAQPEPQASPAIPKQPKPPREIHLTSATPCQLARQLADQLGVRIPAVTALIPAATVSMAYRGQKLVVACGLTAAETYTSQRLLARSGAQLLLFNGDEPPVEVITELADSLGMSFSPVTGDGGDRLPASYILQDMDGVGSDLRLTILPEPLAGEKATP